MYMTFTKCIRRLPNIYDVYQMYMTLTKRIWRLPNVYDAYQMYRTLTKCIWRLPNVYDAYQMYMTLTKYIWRLPNVCDAYKTYMTLTKSIWRLRKLGPGWRISGAINSDHPLMPSKINDIWTEVTKYFWDMSCSRKAGRHKDIYFYFPNDRHIDCLSLTYANDKRKTLKLLYK